VSTEIQLKLPKPLIPNADVFLTDVFSYLPETVITNEEFVERSGLTTGKKTRADWIFGRTGILARHWIREDESCSSLGHAAANRLFEANPAFKTKVEHIVLATISGDYPSPPTAPRLQTLLGLGGSATYDLGAACAGFVIGLQTSASIALATRESILLVASDVRSKFLNLKDYNTAPLFGDGAAAVGISTERTKASRFRLRAVRSFTDGRYADMIMIPGGGSAKERSAPTEGRYPLTIFDGAQIFLKAREAFTLGTMAFLADIQTPLSSIRYLVPHQANAFILREIKIDLGLKDEQVIETISRTGNTSGASVGIAMDEMISNHPLQTGDLILLAAAGGGGLVAHALLERL
jgi:3-oxoacyl-[acyl-carrier-protein] synthase III